MPRLALVCVVSGPERAAVHAALSALDEPDAGRIDLRPAGNGSPEPPTPSAIAEAAGGGPYAVFASGAVVGATVAAVAGLPAQDRPVRLFIARARPPVSPPGVSQAIPVCCSVLCGLHDPLAPPDVMAGWRRHCAGRFSVQVFDGDGAFLTTHHREVSWGIREDLRLLPSHAPDGMPGGAGRPADLIGEAR